MTLNNKHTILLVDDEISITKALQRLFRREGYHILTATSGRDGLALLKDSQQPVSLIISDQRMPEMTGSQFLEHAKGIFPDAIRFLLTGYSDMGAVVEAINKGEIHRYLTKPWNDDDLLLHVRQSLEQFELVTENRRLLELTNKQNRELMELNKGLETKVDERTQEIKKKHQELEAANAQLEKSFMNTIRLLSSLVETLDPKLGRYMTHVAQLSRAVAEEYTLDKEALDQIEMAAMIHDMGLLGSPERMWAREENDMTEAEFKLYSQHPVIAQVCLDSVERLREVGKLILHHHEYYDGSGFPNGLRGDEIPLGSRIIGAVGDYCRIINTWPKDSKQILDKAKRYLGAGTKNLVAKEPDEMLKDVAPKIILLGARQKYDLEVTTNLIKKVEKSGDANQKQKQDGNQSLTVDLEGLKEGMVLDKDLRIKDGRLLLAKGAMLKGSTIETIQRLGEKQLIDGKVSITI